MLRLISMSWVLSELLTGRIHLMRLRRWDAYKANEYFQMTIKYLQLMQVIWKATEKDQSKRYQTALEFKTAIKQAMLPPLSTSAKI